jgi:carboxyl-terminal processing protease
LKKVIAILLLLFLSNEIIAQSETAACTTLSKINGLIAAVHFKPKPINDSLSVYVFTHFLKTIDIRNELFLESEIISLKKHKYKLDDHIIHLNCSFLNEFYSIYQKAINRHIAIIENIKKENFPMNSRETIRSSKNAMPYLKTGSDLKNFNKKQMLYDILREVTESSSNKDSLQTVFSIISETSKQKIFEDYTCKAYNYSLTTDEFYNIFFNVFCSYFDPHTTYFSTNEKSDFLSTISSDDFTLGLSFSVKDKNNIDIDDILPGGPGYFSEKLEIGDQVIKIKSKQEEYFVNCNNFEKIGKILGSSEHKNVSLTMKKKSGEVYTANLYKQVMKNYQNSVYSYVVERENQKTGYIKIPSFYSTLENGKTNVSDDVAKELNKLKEDKITGLIIDLENNGGGSMEEAVTLCGLFMNAPFLAQIVTRTDKKEIVGNQKPKNIYSGPIVILINGFSASASEFFANAMQDYNLALIVGTKSLGKATIQEIVPLKDGYDQFLKITIGKFYRVTGKSNQYKGLIPDIEIPSLFDDQMPKEKDYPTAFKNDKIESIVDTNKYPMNEKQKDAIFKYNQKTKTNLELQKNISMKASFNQFYTQSIAIPLQFNFVFDQTKEFTKRWKDIETFIKTDYPFVITNTSNDLQRMQLSNYLKSINSTQIKNLKTNFRVFESIKIIGNLK